MQGACSTLTSMLTECESRRIYMKELKQIGPRIREDVYDALHDHSDNTRISMSALVEMALKDLLKQAGYDFKDDRRN